jgi:hypothetical protein
MRKLAEHVGYQQRKYHRIRLDFIVYKASETLFVGGDIDLIKACGSLVAYEDSRSSISYGVLRFFIDTRKYGLFALLSPFSIKEEWLPVCARAAGAAEASTEWFVRRSIKTDSIGALVAIPIPSLRRKILLFPIHHSQSTSYLISDEQHVGLCMEDEADADGDAAAPGGGS